MAVTGRSRKALGHGGTGETYSALALRLVASHKGRKVRFTAAVSLGNELIGACAEKRLLRLQHDSR